MYNSDINHNNYNNIMSEYIKNYILNGPAKFRYEHYLRPQALNGYAIYVLDTEKIINTPSMKNPKKMVFDIESQLEISVDDEKRLNVPPSNSQIDHIYNFKPFEK
jgi:hypothetical protein